MKFVINFLIVSLLILQTSFADERKTIIITGATGELGLATARLLAVDYNLILTGRNLAKLNEIQQELKTEHNEVDICTLDFTNPSSIAQFKEHIKSPISGLVLIGPRPLFHGKELIQDEAVWFQVIRETFTGPIEVLKGVLPHLANPSKIVVIAGTTSVQCQPDMGPSCVIRRMWTTYSKALSSSLGPKGISINCLSPGVVLTQFHQERIANKAALANLSYDEAMREEVKAIPLRRHAKPEEVAKTIRFLISEDSDFITGTNMILDGGYTQSY